MNVSDLTDSLFQDDLLAARQWVKDARSQSLRFATLPPPAGLDDARYAAAAGLVELFAKRNGEQPPEWAVQAPAAPRDVWLDKGLLAVPSLKAHAERHAPEALRRRRLFALPDFLSTV